MRLFLVAFLSFMFYYINVAQNKKLNNRLLRKPKDFTWKELIKVLNGFGYKQVSVGKTAGSRVRFIRENYPPITLHKPHPKSILKQYQLEDIIHLLEREKLIKEAIL